MSRSRWADAKTVFDEALHVALPRRLGFVAERCRQDAELRQLVENLLAAHEREDGGFLEPPVQRNAAALLAEVDALADGHPEHVGPYRIVERIGGGGMGHVYRAVRADDAFDKQVAVKLIKRGMDTDDILRRFRTERQTLASLEHPHIARLLDGGATDDGRPYLVMEYIAGEPIDRYCDGRQLTVRQRLALFRDVCAAVQYAHRHLIVHRDLKPANILVTGDGVCKLLDFGIAKLLTPEAETAAPTTVSTLRMMTPRYASPEQMLGGRITTASDVYALGVILFELLTGQSPYGDEATGRELERRIREASPARPSATVRRTTRTRDASATTLRQVAAARQIKPDRLRRLLAGELDTIALRALQKEPSRRYESVEQFAEDVRRHLEGMPITAQPDSRLYRARKFVGRNRVLVGAVSVAVVSLVIGMSAALLAMRDAETARGQAQREADRARLAAEQAGQVTLFLERALKDQGADAHIQELLARAARQATFEFDDRPVIQAALHQIIGESYHALGMWPEGTRQALLALELRRTHLGESHPDTGTSRQLLGETQFRLGQYEWAEEQFQEAVRIRRAEGDRADLATSLQWMGRTCRELSSLEEAESALREAVGLYDQAGESPPADLLAAYARQLQLNGRHGQANEMIAAALSNAGGLGALHTAHDIEPFFSIGDALRGKGDFAGAIAQYRRGQELFNGLLIPDHPYLLYLNMRLRDTYDAVGMYQEALPHAERLVHYYREFCGPRHHKVARELAAYARVLAHYGNIRDALASAQEALAIARHVTSVDRELTAQCLNSLALVKMINGEPAAAAEHFQKAAEMLERLNLTEHADYAVSVKGLAACRLDANDLAAAERWIDRADEVEKHLVPQAHPRMAECRYLRARLLLGQGHYQAAGELFANSLHMYRRAHSEASRTAEIRVHVAHARMLGGRLDLAASAAQYAYEHLAAHTHPENPATVMALNALVEIHTLDGDQGRLAAAQENLARIRGRGREP